MDPIGKKIMQTIAVGVIALAMCVVTVLVVQRNAVVPQASLAAKLPAENVVLYAKINTMEQLAAMDEELGIQAMIGAPLPSIGSGSYEFAVLSQSGALHWVLQSTGRNDSRVTGPASDMLIGQDGDRPAFTVYKLPAFNRMRSRAAPAVWMRTDTLLRGATGAPDVLLTAMLKPYSHVMWHGGGAAAVSLIRMQKQTVNRPAGPIGVAPAGTLDILDAGLAARAVEWMGAMEVSDDALHEGIEGIVTQRLRDALGADAADVLAGLSPKIAGLRVARDTGGLLYAAAFQDAGANDVDRLLATFAAGLPQTAIRDIPLKKNERTDIAVDEDAVQHGEERVGGWRLRWVGLKDGSHMLAVAQSGPRTLVSVNVGLLRSMAAETASPDADPKLKGAGGVLDGDLLDAALSDTLPMFRHDEASRLWRLLPKKARWIFMQQPDADVLAIKEVTR